LDKTLASRGFPITHGESSWTGGDYFIAVRHSNDRAFSMWIRKKQIMRHTCMIGTLVLLFFPAAMTAQEPPKPSAENVRVNVYRYKQYMGKGLRPSIFCDEKDVARLQSGRYVVLALAPGKHTFRSNDKQSQIDLDLKAGQEYYIRIDIATGMWKGHGRLTLVLAEQGAGELKQMKPVDAGMIKDKEFLAADFQPTT